MTDDYRCVGLRAADIFPEIRSKELNEVYVMGFLTDATSDKAHHLILSHCNKANGPDGKIFQCLHHGMCSSGDSKIMYAWAKDAPGINLPPDAGFVVRAEEYIVLQVHYKHPLQNPDFTSLQLKYTTNKPNYRAGMIMMLRNFLEIPPRTPKTFGDINCRIKTKEPMYLFAFRTHAHSLGAVISGYQFAYDPKTKNNSFQPYMIAKGDPQLPQTFYAMKNYVEVENGDILAARCTFDSSNMTTFTKIGMGSNDEMCNLYLMYYSKNPSDFLICSGEEEGHFELPEEASTRISGKVLEETIPGAPPQLPPTEPIPTSSPSSLTEHAKRVLSKHIETLGSYVPKSRMMIGISVLSAVLTLLCSLLIACRKCKKRGKGNMTRTKSTKSSWKSKKTLDLGDFLGRSKTGFTRLKTDENDEEVSSEDSDLEDFTVPALNA
eukprot:TRINITY_DN4797_c0_g1_i4.p1 TRINITY_DN4797_c0_g1~~TRINITY_DN4797_c0_g1_i4.p1  ORF type:complete len:455 (+),score=106.94 TRINITY_DN4797_c0_g1_i4:63-1367(+)